jgi:putative membrane protein
MRNLLIRWIINAVALAIAATLVRGIHVDGGWQVLALAALIFGLVNALIRPLVTLLTCPLIILTLGLFTLVINAGMLLLASWLAGIVGIGFSVEGFWPAFWGGLVISIVSAVLSLVLKDDYERGRTRRVKVEYR